MIQQTKNEKQPQKGPNFEPAQQTKKTNYICAKIKHKQNQQTRNQQPKKTQFENMKNISVQEEAAIYYSICTGVTDRATLFKIARGENAYNALSTRSKSSGPVQWYNLPRMQKAIEQITRDLEAEKNKIIEMAKREVILEYESRGDTEGAPGAKRAENANITNFLNLDEFLTYANKQANTIQDEKERRSWVELIGKYMNFKEREEETTETKKYYIMKTCENCEIYNRCKDCNINNCPAIEK